MGKMKKSSRLVLLGRGWKALLIVAIGSILLVGCGTLEGEITFYEGERWRYLGRIAIPAEVVEMAGGEGALESELQSSLREEAPDVEVSWDKKYEGQNVVYHVTAEGEGWEKLNRFAFDGNASITREDGKIYFTFSIPWEAESVVSSLTLRGGKIISSNADKQTDGSAIWHRPTGTVEAVLTEKGRFNWLPILLFLLVISVVGGAMSFVARRPSKERAVVMEREIACPQCGTVNSPGARFCKHCGARLEAQVVICPKCGAENKPEAKFCANCGTKIE